MKKIIVLVAVLLALALSAFMYWTTGNMAADARNPSPKIFVINKGDSIREIGNNLKTQGLIRDAVVFFIYIKLNSQDKNIQAGDYRLFPSMTLSKIVNELNHGTLDIWVTIPEGFRAEEIADTLEKNIPSYNKSWRQVLIANEGYLFPDTYLIPRDVTDAMIVKLMRNNFNTKISEIGLTSTDPRLHRIVTIASLIEREAITNAEKPLISGILNNRLQLGMALQVDATIQYAKGYDTTSKKWWPPVTLAEYKSVNSSYNTYLISGLPPGPIANPGIEAIKAALNPLDTFYLYYIHDVNGKIHPAKTSAEHAANIQKYL